MFTYKRITSTVIYIILSIAVVFRVWHLYGSNVRNKDDMPPYSDAVIINNPFLQKISKIRETYRMSVQEYFPSPHCELLLGMVVGIDDLKYVKQFQTSLINTGTIHVVVVSGYNISLVFNMVMGVLGSRYKLNNVIIAQSVTFLYAVVSGFEPPVIRSWIMGSISSLGKYYGRNINAERILIVAALVMIIANPKLVESASFHLSFLACVSLLLFNDKISSLVNKVINSEKRKSSWYKIFFDDFATSLSAQILVWPYISYKFGRISLISPFVNSLILWTVPISTILGFIFIPAVLIHKYLGLIVSYVALVPLDIFVKTVTISNKISYISVEHKIPVYLLCVYYVFVLFISWRLKRGVVYVFSNKATI